MELLPQENKGYFIIIRVFLLGAFISAVYGSIQYMVLLRRILSNGSFPYVPSIAVFQQDPIIIVYMLLIPSVLCIGAYILSNNKR